MASKNKKDGFQSAAGLIRYFDVEVDKGPIIDPKLLVYMVVLTMVVIELCKVFW